MTKLGIIASADKQTILETIALLEKVPGLKVVYITQKENINLYIVEEQDFYRLKSGVLQ